MDGNRYASRELVYARMETHMKAFASHFGEAVYAYDVVNEATLDSGFGRRMPPFAGLNVYRQTQYLTMCGIDYLTKAFKIMAEAAPHAQLFYNDYNEYVPEKRERIITLIKNDQMKEKFLTICSTLLTEKYVKQDLLDQVDEWVATLEPLMAEQIARWKKCSPKSVDSWLYEVNAFKKCIRARYKYVINYLSDYFKLDKDMKAFYFGQVLENNK